MTDEHTRSELAKLWENPDARHELLKYAASFFGNSIRRTVLGVDAHSLVMEAMQKVMASRGGLPQPTREPVAYMKTVIRSVWIDKHRQGQILKDRADEIVEMYQPRDEPDFAEALIDDLARGGAADDIAEAFESYLERHRPPVPEVGRALRDNPGHSVQQIADLVGTSQRTVYRAKDALRNDANMRVLLDRISTDDDLDGQGQV